MGLAGFPVFAQQPAAPWVETFQVSPATYSLAVPKNLPKELEFLSRTGPVTGTLRYRFGISIGGSRLEVKLSNELGDKPLKIDGASIGIAASEMNAVPGSIRRLTFDGKESVVIPPGAPVLSDPIDLEVTGASDLVGSVFVKDPVGLSPMGGASMLLADGDAVLSEKLANARHVVSRPMMTSLLVIPPRTTHLAVAFGDSISDGARDQPSVAHGWVATLAGRMASDGKSPALAVVSAGIGGNRILRSGLGPAALARADRDVFSAPGLHDVILLEGINDIGFSGASLMGAEPALDLQELIAGYRQIAMRAHARGVRIYIGTLTPFQGAFYFTDEKETLRQSVNAWIRSSKDFDGVIDFEAVLRDPAQPGHMKSEFDSGDHLHPSAAGYKAMGDSIDLSLFR